MKWERLVEHAPWGRRAMPRGGWMDGYFYVISGRAGTITLYGDTWRSPDGINWERMSKRGGWGKRCYPEIDFVDGHIVLTGGQGLRTFYNDVWRSPDRGRSWELVCAEAPWNIRAGHHTAVFDGVIYLFGGARNSVDRTFYPELWVSRDRGETWELHAELPEDMARAGMQVVRIDGTLYYMGGDHDKPVFRINKPGRRNDVWKSADMGKTWELLGDAPWVRRTGHQCVAWDGKVICIGGHAAGKGKYEQILMHDMWIWDPHDGMGGWRHVSDNVWGCEDNPKNPGKSDFMLEVHDDKLWTFGAERALKSPWAQDNDVWVADLRALAADT